MGVVALTGASGYVGSHLLELLERDGMPVRALSRSPERLEGRVAEETEVVRADLLDEASLEPALAGVDALVYLVHGLAEDDFAEVDRRAALNTAQVAARAGVGRIVYLGGLGRGELSPHLASRQEVGRILRDSGVTTIELRASIVLGSGSASYELLRAIVENIPAAAVPNWVESQSQPIAVDDVVAYLRGALELETDESRIYEIGGPERLSYLDLVNLYAEEHGLNRVFVPLPVPAGAELLGRALEPLAPERATVWLRLIESLRNETTVEDDAAARDFPAISPRPVAEALRAAG